MELSIYSRPPEKISKEIRKLIREIKKYFGKNRASRYPLPHLTIRSSFKIPKKDFPEVCGILKEEFRKLKKPKVKIEGWGQTPNNLDIYGFHLNVKEKSKIQKIHKKLEKLFPKYKKTYTIKGFFPHISLAWEMKNKVKKEDFEKTKEFMKKLKFKREYVFDKLYVHEKIGKDRYRFIKIIK
tara:strand:- start:6777 stop:7322 length:546 start_codon:yes stop_codon:yes gene_type:complete